jgi:predicted nucleic acid-binding Zn ribbon protein
MYTFKCPSCQREEDITQSMKAPVPVCMRCANASCGIHIVEMERVWKKTSKPRFKGKGFYETDYKDKK